MDFATFMSAVSWIITGSIAGYVASLILRAERRGCLINIALGIAGAFVGGLVLGRSGFNLFLFGSQGLGGFLSGIIHAIVGAALILILIEIVVPGKQLGVRREQKKSKRRRRR